MRVVERFCRPLMRRRRTGGYGVWEAAVVLIVNRTVPNMVTSLMASPA